MLTHSAQSVDEPLLEQEDVRPHRSQPPARVGVAIATLVLVVVAILFLRGWRPTSSPVSPTPTSPASVMPVSAEIETTFGVRFTGVDVTAGGGMIQIHYQVLDSDKTEAIHGTDLAPVIIDSHGAQYADPGMVGHSHVGKTQAAGTTDYILLANAKGGVAAGSTVTIKVGDLELRGVPVL